MAVRSSCTTSRCHQQSVSDPVSPYPHFLLYVYCSYSSNHLLEYMSHLIIIFAVYFLCPTPTHWNINLTRTGNFIFFVHSCGLSPWNSAQHTVGLQYWVNKRMNQMGLWERRSSNDEEMDLFGDLPRQERMQPRAHVTPWFLPWFLFQALNPCVGREPSLFLVTQQTSCPEPYFPQGWGWGGELSYGG